MGACGRYFASTFKSKSILDTQECTVNQKKKKKKKNGTSQLIPIQIFVEILILAPINMDYCLLQFDALKCFSGVRLHAGVSLPYFNFFNVNPQI